MKLKTRCSSSRGWLARSTAPAHHALPSSPEQPAKIKLKNMTRKEIEGWCASLGEENPTNRALQLWRAMYADDNWIKSLEETYGRQGGFSSDFIAKASQSTVDGGLELKQVVRSTDGTRKMAFTLAGTSQVIETVLIPVIREAGQRRRITLCVSSQVGCAMNCQFCFTGRMGLVNQLSTSQIIEQIVQAKRLLAEEKDDTPLTNLVFMGMTRQTNTPLCPHTNLLTSRQVWANHSTTWTLCVEPLRS
jgi:23S rRNA (adenine2503-C2)-methyltransferase